MSREPCMCGAPDCNRCNPGGGELKPCEICGRTMPAGLLHWGMCEPCYQEADAETLLRQEDLHADEDGLADDVVSQDARTMHDFAKRIAGASEVLRRYSKSGDGHEVGRMLELLEEIEDDARRLLALEGAPGRREGEA